MSTTGYFNSGTELSLSIFADLAPGVPVQLDGRRDMFEVNDKDRVLESTPSDNGGRVDHKNIPGGYQGSIRVDKNSANFSKLYRFLQANFYAGGAQQFYTITATIRSPIPGGKPERVQFTKCVFSSWKGGQWEKNSRNQPTFDFHAQEAIDL